MLYPKFTQKRTKSQEPISLSVPNGTFFYKSQGNPKSNFHLFKKCSFARVACAFFNLFLNFFSFSFLSVCQRVTLRVPRWRVFVTKRQWYMPVANDVPECGNDDAFGKRRVILSGAKRSRNPNGVRIKRTALGIWIPKHGIALWVRLRAFALRSG